MKSTPFPLLIVPFISYLQSTLFVFDTIANKAFKVKVLFTKLIAIPIYCSVLYSTEKSPR